jgi:heme exporter protein A
MSSHKPTDPHEPAISVQGLIKRFGHSVVLREVNLRVARGECFALFGANGSGKTTLLRVLATLHAANGGSARVAGFDVREQRQQVRERLFLVTHGSHLYEDFDALENVRFTLGLRSLRRSETQCLAALKRVGLAGFLDLKVRHYSSGMKKRLAFAKAMLLQPEVLLLDEPYAALDEHAMGMINEFIGELTTRGGTVLMATHNRARSGEVARRYGLLERGVLKLTATPGLHSADGETCGLAEPGCAVA